ncbi:GspH/FimT family pseudopilin [Halomonas mongoliensis]|uniref:GspH/FimT family pseudopilin n=1 Tax=Halomonas mongoliensis TaxID=321265 RepID=UPI00403B33DD
MKRPSGFTLIELLVTVAVIAILATVAVPGFQSLVASNRMASDVNTLISGLQLARSEAVKRGTTVSLVPNGSPPWGFEVRDGATVIHSHISSHRATAIAAPALTIAFDAQGRAPACGAGGCQLTLIPTKGSATAKALTVSRLGRAEVKDTEQGEPEETAP